MSNKKYNFILFLQKYKISAQLRNEIMKIFSKYGNVNKIMLNINPLYCGLSADGILAAIVQHTKSDNERKFWLRMYSNWIEYQILIEIRKRKYLYREV